MEVVFVDWTPISQKNDIYGGGDIRRYYAWISLNRMVNKVIPFRKKSNIINWKTVANIFKKNSVIWLEYPCGRIAHLVVLLAFFIRSKKFVLNVHDFAIQQKYFNKERNFLKKIQLQFIEYLLLNHAHVIILAMPGLLDYFMPKKSQKIIIMPPGVGTDELILNRFNKTAKKNVALYFGSMQRKGMIPKIIELFSNLEEWELYLVGSKEGQEITEKENVKYLGKVNHNRLEGILNNADVILIPSPKNDYLSKVMPIKTGYALKSCKPIIATKLKAISEYVSMLGLESNVIYLDEWNLEDLKKALRKAQELNVDAEKTIERLRTVAWEPRFKKAIEIAFEIHKGNQEMVEWV